MEREALKQEDDKASKAQMELVEGQISKLEREYADLNEIWQAEKASVKGSQNVKEELEKAKFAFEKALRTGDTAEMSRLKYGLIPDLEKQLTQADDTEHAPHQLLRNKVTEVEIAEVVSKATGIPVSKMMEGDREKLLRMEEALHQRVVGQHEAVEAVSNAVRRARSGLSDPNRPSGSFLFLGPTGVGKTELCKALANFLFDSDDAIIRIDMSEFMEKHSVSRLIGAPPGYVGYEEGGYLTEAVRRKPYSVILLDEVEKAHPDVFNVLLQVLEDGRLTDGQGRTVDFKNTVIIMTSNLGSDVIRHLSEDKQYDHIKLAVLEVVGKHFRPEFINRIDEMVVFHPLAEEQIRGIAEIQLERLRGRLAERDLKIELSEAAMEQLVVAGYDPVYGARPLKRAIQTGLENPLAHKILSGEFIAGDTILADVEHGNLVFHKKRLH
jgi:ATP-dependent Clp protease ATP-binding subunit ClpB